MSTIKVGQIYASTHSGDVTRGTRQRRRVTEVRALSRAVWLVTEDGPPYLTARPSRVMLRSTESRTIPGHRLVEEGKALMQL